MAVAPPDIRDLDVLVLSATRRRDVGTVALVRYLQTVRPRVLVLMGRAWLPHLRDVATFRDALLANELERLIGKGCRAYLLDPRLRSAATIRLPRGRTVAHRPDLRLRIEGQWIWCGARQLLETPWQRLGGWVRQLPSGWGAAAGGEPGADLSALGTHARDGGLDTVVIGDKGAYIETVGQGGPKVASPGAWHDGGRALEFRFGRWSLRDGDAPEVGSPPDREKLGRGALS